jgi:hypothetical protein
MVIVLRIENLLGYDYSMVAILGYGLIHKKSNILKELLSKYFHNISSI